MANIEVDGPNKTIKVDSGNLTLDIPGDIILDADGANVTFKDGGTSVLDLSNSSTDAVLTVSTQDKDLIIKGDDGGAAITAATFDMSDAGTLILNHDLVVADAGKVGSASATDAMTISSGGIVTFKDDILIKDAGTIGSASDADAIAIASNGVVTFSQAPVFPDGSIAVADLDIDGATDIGAAIVDADLFVIDDGAGGTNRKTTASRLKTYIGGGITEFDQWRVSTAFSGDAEPVASNWERPDTGNFEYIGTGMSQSSGIFTFPSTGKYWIQFAASFYYEGTSNYNHIYIRTTNDNSSYTNVAQGTTSTSDNARAGQAHITYLFDVTNTTTHKAQFYVTLEDNSTTVNADTNFNVVYASFIRIGDT